VRVGKKFGGRIFVKNFGGRRNVELSMPDGAVRCVGPVNSMWTRRTTLRKHLRICFLCLLDKENTRLLDEKSNGDTKKKKQMGKG
jgi:hypothetical protein